MITSAEEDVSGAQAGRSRKHFLLQLWNRPCGI